MAARTLEFWLVAYYMARCGERPPDGGPADPPNGLGTSSWTKAYQLFMPTIGGGRTPRALHNSLKAARDTFDSHIETGRIGWREQDATRTPATLPIMARQILAEWGERTDLDLTRAVSELSSVGLVGDNSEWRSDVGAVINTLPEDFSLEQIYEFEEELQVLHPNNNYVQVMVRESLRQMRDRGLIDFIDERGNYRKTRPQTILPSGDEVDDARREGQLRSKGRSRGQGFASSYEFRSAVESRAMTLACDHYKSEGWDVHDVSRHESFDFLCTQADGSELHVEVKGTTGDGSRVFLTPNEVSHTREFPRVDLFVVYGIVVEGSNDTQLTAHGGALILYANWIIDDGELTPTGYSYELSSVH